MQLTFLTLDDFTQELSNQGVSTVRVDALERIQSRGEAPPRRIGEIVATARLDENTVAVIIFRILDEPAGPQTPADLVRCGDNARQAIELLGECSRDRGLEVRPGFWEFECLATAGCDMSILHWRQQIICVFLKYHGFTLDGHFLQEPRLLQRMFPTRLPFYRPSYAQVRRSNGCASVWG